MTPHVKGITLTELLKENGGHIQEGAIKFITAQITLAIGDLHSKGIVFRNLTADNIIVERDGFIKLVDF